MKRIEVKRIEVKRLSGRLAGGLISGALGAALAVLPGLALELRGATYFTKPPWSVDLISYQTYTYETRPEYYFRVSLDAAAGAPLGGLTIRQTRGVDRQFPFSVDRTTAFLGGTPRRGGEKIPVGASFEEAARLFTITFPEPVQPGNTVTVVLRPWTNPSASDTYMFEVMALPAGPNPSPASLGYGTLRIYNFGDFN
ncbi:DUF2808 domain-containing protein [Cyanobium sp. WAJ14-Wanaka]|uniref:DUF2808 domain-containing protein n=1 Tax=Cyanobium sp. WAJ14-Wanaka TaxID=2823725 RepID=UPI0020CC545C|nr:DUF2808 domain-containing protein [Cyanobium sp. WAJ14-Wanaka]